VEEAEKLMSGKANAKYWGKESDAVLASLAAGFDPAPEGE
jgi:hypothetical protein